MTNESEEGGDEDAHRGTDGARYEAEYAVRNRNAHTALSNPGKQGRRSTRVDAEDEKWTWEILCATYIAGR